MTIVLVSSRWVYDMENGINVSNYSNEWNMH